MRSIKNALLPFSLAALVACGGGGGSDGGSSGSNAVIFDVNSAFRSNAASGQTVNFSVTSSNGCVGTGVYAVGAANSRTTFEGKAAFSATSMLNISFTNCTPAAISYTSNAYFDLNYLPIGVSGDEYLVYTGTVNVPASAKVGDVGIFGNAIRYTNSTKAVQDGTAQLSYLVEADSASSAMITVATKTYNMSNVLESTQLTKYKITSSNVMTPVGITIQYPNGQSVVFTKA